MRAIDLWGIWNGIGTEIENLTSIRFSTWNGYFPGVAEKVDGGFDDLDGQWGEVAVRGNDSARVRSNARWLTPYLDMLEY